MKKIFISYSRQDWPLVRHICKELSPYCQVLIDATLLNAGDDWQTVLDNNIASASVFFVLVSHSSVTSEAVLNELATAKAKQKRIVPIILEDVPIPAVLSAYQCVDIRYSIKNGIDAIKQIVVNQNVVIPQALAMPARFKQTGYPRFQFFSSLPTLAPGFPAPWSVRIVYIFGLLSVVPYLLLSLILSIGNSWWHILMLHIIPLHTLWGYFFATRRLCIRGNIILLGALYISECGYSFQLGGTCKTVA